MNILKTLVYAWQEDQVPLPPSADRALVSDGVKLVLDLIERIRRVEAHRHEEAIQTFSMGLPTKSLSRR